MIRVLRLQVMLCVIVAALAGCASQPKFRALSPDWQNPDHGRFMESLVLLLRAPGRDPMGCSLYFFKSRNLSATSLGNCMFRVSTGLASTGDEKLIRGILAKEVAHEVLGHADKRKAAREAAAKAGGTLGVLSIFAAAAPGGRPLALPPTAIAYSPSQHAEAKEKAAEILRDSGDPDSAGTMEHASLRFRDAGIVEPWPQGPSNIWQILMAVAPLVPGVGRPTYTIDQQWIRSDGEYRLVRIDRDLYIFSAGPDQEIHLTKDLMVARARKGGWVTEFDSLPELWPLAVGKAGIGEGRWHVPNDPTRIRVQYFWSIEAYEEVTVPAGTFKAFRIVFSWEPLTTGSGIVRRQFVSWYAPEVGQLVKAESSDAGPLSFELVAVDRAGEPPADKAPGTQLSSIGSPTTSVLTRQTASAFSLEPPKYAVGLRWIRSDAEYRLARVENNLYIFVADQTREIHLTRELVMARVRSGAFDTAFDPPMKLSWPLRLGSWGQGQATWNVPLDPTRLRVTYTWAVEALEDVRLPARQFKAFRIVLEWQPAVLDVVTMSNFPKKRLVLWYAPEIQQLVKGEYSDPGPLNFHIVALDAPTHPSALQAPEGK